MLENKLVFNYANDYKLKHNQLSSIKDFSITDAIYNDFTTYFSSQEVSYETYTEKQLKVLEKSAEDDRYAEAIQEDINQLKQHIKKEKSKDLQRFRKEIEKLLYLEIVSRYYYQKGRIEAALYDDPQVEKVKKLLQDKAAYTKILSTQK